MHDEHECEHEQEHATSLFRPSTMYKYLLVFIFLWLSPANA